MSASAPDAWAASSAAVAHMFVTTLDDVLVVDGDDGHHLQRVRRIDAGEHVTAADGDGGWREYVVMSTGSGTVGLEATGPLRHEPRLAPALAVAFALTKGEQPELVVRGLTELGVDRVLPVVSSRSQVRWRGERAANEHGRLQRVAREAGMQCRRARLPRIEPLAEVATLAGHPGLVVADRAGSEYAGSEYAGSASSGPPAEWLVVVGPEGGLGPEEADALGGRRLGVGPHVLRAGTAAIAVAAVLTGQRVRAGDLPE